jgi:hypothetical protein
MFFIGITKKVFSILVCIRNFENKSRICRVGSGPYFEIVVSRRRRGANDASGCFDRPLPYGNTNTLKHDNN